MGMGDPPQNKLFAPIEPMNQSEPQRLRFCPLFSSKSWDAPGFQFQFFKGIHNIVTTCQPKFREGTTQRDQPFPALQKVSSVSGTELCQMPRLTPTQDSWKIFQGKWKHQVLSHLPKQSKEVQRKNKHGEMTLWLSSEFYIKRWNEMGLFRILGETTNLHFKSQQKTPTSSRHSRRLSPKHLIVSIGC